VAFQARWIPTIAVGVAVLGAFVTWTGAGAVQLDGAESPNNGWLVVILGVFALGWIRLMDRGSWVGVAGVLGASIVMLWTALEDWLDSRAVLDANAGLGLVLVIVAALALATSAVVRGVELTRHRPGQGASK
jgi:hypothetical protein